MIHYYSFHREDGTRELVAVGDTTYAQAVNIAKLFGYVRVNELVM